MIAIGNNLLSDDIVEKQFVCDLAKCKGGCCEEGDAGAPLEKEELSVINEVFDIIRPYLSPVALNEIAQKGYYVYDRGFGWVTPTLGDNSGICVYANRDKNGVIKCAFEQAYNEGKITWKKPLSCHLYPIVVKKARHGNFDLVNYQPRETLCKAGCSLGKKLQVPVYQFLKEAIVRKFGMEFYQELDAIATRETINV